MKLFHLLTYLMQGGLPALPVLPDLPSAAEQGTITATANATGTSTTPAALPSTSTSLPPTSPSLPSAVPSVPPTDPDLGFTIINGPPPGPEVSFATLTSALTDAFVAAISAVSNPHGVEQRPPPSPRRFLFHRLRQQRLRSTIPTANVIRPAFNFTVPASTATATSPPPSPPRFAGRTTTFNPLYVPSSSITTTPSVPTASTAPTPFSNSRLSDIVKFTGTEANAGLAFDRWLQVINSYFALFPTISDGERIAAATQCLAGPAQDWVRINAPSPFTANAWNAFTSTLEATFAPLDRSMAARVEFASCRQISTAQDYLLRFNLASAPITDLHPSEKFQRFKEGLKHHIRQQMVINHPEIQDFAAAAAYAVRYDMLSTSPASDTSFVPRPAAPYRPPPARINAISSPAPITTTGPHAPLTPEERAAINLAGGCTYCRNVTIKPLHTIDACPVRRPRPTYQLGNGRPQ